MCHHLQPISVCFFAGVWMRHSITAGLVHQRATTSTVVCRTENMWMTGKDLVVLAYEKCFLAVVFSW